MVNHTIRNSSDCVVDDKLPAGATQDDNHAGRDAKNLFQYNELLVRLLERKRNWGSYSLDGYIHYIII